MEKLNSLAGEIARQCSTCRFSKEEAPNPHTLQRVRRCFRFPPHVTSLPTPQGIAQATAFPQVTDAQHCYEWQGEPVKLTV